MFNPFRSVCAIFLTLLLLAGSSAPTFAGQLLSVSAQQLTNNHTRVLLQFDQSVAVRLLQGFANNTVILQATGSMLAPGVPSFFPVNTGNVQSISTVLAGGGVRIILLLHNPAQSALSLVASNLYAVDVSPGANAGYVQSAPSNVRGATPAPSQQQGGQLTQMYRLHYADVAEVIGLLVQNVTIAPSNIFNPQPNQFGSSPLSGAFGTNPLGQYGTTFNNVGPTVGGLTGQQYTGSTQENALSQRINDNLAIDRRLNAIIVTGSQQQLAQAEAIIKLVDVPVESVLIDTQVLEITDTGDKALGLNYSQTPNTPITRIFNAQYQILNGLPTNAIPGVPPLATDIFLLVSKGQAKVLASPKILTEDRLPASIVTGDSLPIRISTPVGIGGVGAVTSQVEYVNVGVNLQILPRITGEHSLETDVFSQVSSVTGFNATGDPQISSRQAQTRVALFEGQTLVIGGLIQSRDIRNLQKIPIIGDIPIIGALFRFYTETRQNTNLVIAITPHIVPLTRREGPQVPQVPQVQPLSTAPPSIQGQ